MRGVVRRAELPGEQAGQRLHLVAPGKQGKFLRVGRADFSQTLFQHPEGLVPADGLEGVLAALRPGLAPQRPGQTCRRVLLHDSRGALGANHAFVQRMIRVTFDIANLAVLNMRADAAAAGAHVTGGVLDFDGLGGRFVHGY